MGGVQIGFQKQIAFERGADAQRCQHLSIPVHAQQIRQEMADACPVSPAEHEFDETLDIRSVFLAQSDQIDVHRMA